MIKRGNKKYRKQMPIRMGQGSGECNERGRKWDDM